jgi:uncharacterized protein
LKPPRILPPTSINISPERNELTDAFVDTAFVIALINKADQYHSIAMQISDSVEGRTLVTTDAVLLEIGNALSKNFKREAVRIIEHFLTSRELQVIHLDPTLFMRGFEL